MVLTTKPSAVNVVQTRSHSASSSAASSTTNTDTTSHSASSSAAISGTNTASTSTNTTVSTAAITPVRNMGASLHMEYFNGENGEDIEKFLKRFDQYCTCTNIKDDQAVAQLAWHLGGFARLYDESQSPAPTTLDQLKTLLTNKFKLENPVNLDIFNMKQEISENAEQFLTRLEAETFKTNIKEDLQVQIALNGLHPSVSSTISTHGPKNLSDVRNLARRLTNVSHTAPIASVISNVADLGNTMNILTAAVSQLSTIMTNPERCQQPSQGNSPQHRRQQGDSSEQACSRCGGRCTSTKSCKAWGKTCSKCGYKNHFANKCRTGRDKLQENQNDSS
ncbi:uncharacterized protein LOC123531142 [Mercenaria mercenaria]|uniref:uncharacterized protein LOC123531142 n=1 Tax=Mercenaria mercenaria TaxID=6596 RepID=UPI001E1DD551|nr:uncharacterized protein LOC123531142 [Mercenaria mercenaria]